ncbi:Sre G protein-coupled chemoreceptor [Dictyocaulus viviparus]|uniref:Sre G protein-coupled chemoreceptor n=1 Tax=Dictyocaulus viviparus TaxID=29172 RepID=A0A0D8XWA8_DICVI|nr:Sre G protein-coupled chemoreceptor [Dictyocaulus viviparus]
MSSLLNCSRCEVCSSAVSIYSSMSFVHLSLVFRLVIGPICIVSILLLTIAIFQTKTLHFNARLLLLCMTTSMIVGNIALRNVYIVGGLGFTISTLFLATERTIATVTYITYEKHGRRCIGTMLATIQILACILLYVSIEPSQQLYPYVAPDILNSQRSKIFGNVLYGMNMVALSIFAILYFINKHRKKSLTDSHLRVLSTRFQLRENIATTRLMTPVMLLVTLLMSSSQLVYYSYLPDLNQETVITQDVLVEIVNFAPFSEYQISLMPVTTLMLVFLLPYFHLHIKRSFVRVSRLRRCFPERFTSVDTVTVDQARDIYFHKLNGQWHENAFQRKV